MTLRSPSRSSSPRPLGRALVHTLPLALLLLGGGIFAASLSGPATAATPDDYRLSSLRVFNRVVLLVKEQYVEPERIHPREMLVASLEAVEKRVPEVLVEAPEGDSIGVVVGDERRTFFLDDLTSLWELSFKLRDVFRFMETRMSDEVDRRDVEYAAVNGMLSKLDPHSVLLEPRYSKEMKLSTKGEFGGLGIVISIRDGYLTVISPIDGTPAARAGILAQDRIVKIGEESTINMGLDEAVERLRGKPGTEVVIWVERKGLDEPKRHAIVRDIIKVESVTHELLEDQYGYVKVKQFQGRTAEDVSDAVKAMEKKAGGKLKGVVLDLRNNPGGLLDQAVEVSNLFLDDGVIVVTQEGGVHGERKEVRATRRPDKIRVPVVVLVNGGSASASEIVAGAIKNRGRGLIVGDQTFGKGSVQQLYDFPDSSSLKLTIGQYLTPGDESIQSVGIAPDLLVRPLLASDLESLNLFPDQSTREEDLARHLDDARTVAKKPVYELSFLDKPLDEGEAERRATSSAFHDDFETKLARRILSLVNGNDRDALLQASRAAVDQSNVEEEAKIRAALEKLGVDWTAGPAATGGKLVTRVIAAEPAAAGDTLKVTLEAENAGKDSLYRVHGVSDSTFGLFVDQEFLFGKLAPGQKRQWSAEVKIPKNLSSRRDVMRVAFQDANGGGLGRLDVPISVDGGPRPRFSYALFIDDTPGGNGDGLLQAGEEVNLVVSIRNAGPGVAEQPTALLKNLGGSELFIETGRQQLGALKPGTSATARFSFRVQASQAEAAEMRLQVFDGLMGDYLLEKLRFPIRSTGPAAKPHRQVVQVSQDGVPVLAAAEGGAAVLARASAGSRLDAVAEVGEYVRVKIGDVLGYVASADVKGASGRVPLDAKGQPKGLSFVYGRDPPRVSFLNTTGEAMTVDADRFKVKFRVEDDGPVRDVYVFNGEEKIYYDALKSGGPTDATVEVDLKLEPGVNLVTVVAREDDEFAQREVLTLFSKRGDPLAEKKRAH